MSGETFDAADAVFSSLAGDSAEAMFIYGPPRSIRGKIANRLRRLFGRDERDELYGYVADIPVEDIEFGAERVTVRWTVPGERDIE